MDQDTAITLNEATAQKFDVSEATKELPPLAQLMVFAIARSATGRMTTLSISQWLRTNFVRYAERHNDCYKRSRRSENQDYLEPCRCEMDIATQISGAFADEKFLYGLLSPFKFHKDERSLSLVPGSAQLALQSGVPEECTFERYNELPAELRQEILRHAFTFNIESPGWKVKEISRSYSGRYYFEATVNGRRLSQIRLSAMLSPLSVSKQMRTEAGALFFTTNTFHFENCFVMREFMAKLGPQNRSHLTSVSLEFMSPGYLERDRLHANSALRLLSEARSLQHLRISVHESYALRQGSEMTPHGFPGYNILRRIRGLKTFTLEGDCRWVRQELGEDLLRPCRKRTGELIKSEAQLRAAREKRIARRRQLDKSHDLLALFCDTRHSASWTDEDFDDAASYL